MEMTEGYEPNPAPEPRDVSRKGFLARSAAAGLSAAAVPVLRSAADPARAAGSRADRTTIRFQSFQSGDVVKKWQTQFAAFTKQTGITVVHEYVPSAATLEKTLTAAAGGQLPDVAMVSASWHRALAVRGLFEEFTPARFTSLKIGDFWPRLVNDYTVDGRIYGLPTDLDLTLAFYNQDIFQQFDVAAPGPDWTWDQFAALAAKLTKGGGPGKYYGTTAGWETVADMVAWSYGGALIDERGNRPVSTITGAPAVRAMNLLNRILVVDKSAPRPNSDADANGMGAGRVAMGLYGPWAAWYVYKDSKFKWSVVPAPRGDRRSVLAWGSALGIFNSSRNKDAVAKFVEFFLSPAMQFQRASDWAWFPPGRAATAMPGFSSPAVLNLSPAQKQYVINSVAYGQAPLVVKDEAQIDDVFNNQLAFVVTGGKPMSQAIKDIDRAWVPLLASS